MHPHLGPIIDKDPEWRMGAVFNRPEAVTIISTPVIPPDRQMVYAIELFTGMRPGEGAALRWRNYDPTMEPLGKLVVAISYNTRKSRAKGTKTNSVRHIPVHPTLAAMLAEWKLVGWSKMMGRQPGPDDLIVPLPPQNDCSPPPREQVSHSEATTTRASGGAKRTCRRSAGAIGQHYDMKATFITVVGEDGARRDIIQDLRRPSSSRREPSDPEACCKTVAKDRHVFRRKRSRAT